MNPNQPNQSTKVDDYKFVPYRPERIAAKEMAIRAKEFSQIMQKRRSTRHFSTKPVPRQAIVNAIEAASSAPSGAHKQPWSFCLISSQKLKSDIRQKAEAEEFESYNSRMNDEWLEDLAPLGTDHIKPYIELAPYLIVVFKKTYDLMDGKKRQNYYVSESVGIAVGMLLSALQHAGLATLTHTPSPMKFLSEILDRPDNEKPYLLIPVGYASDDATVPDLRRKPLNEVMCEYE